jgi:hypothetical protein
MWTCASRWTLVTLVDRSPPTVERYRVGTTRSLVKARGCELLLRPTVTGNASIESTTSIFLRHAFLNGVRSLTRGYDDRVEYNGKWPSGRNSWAVYVSWANTRFGKIDWLLSQLIKWEIDADFSSISSIIKHYD